ncbi:MAG: SDR family NAD(P)-dependent oxidoreductase [Candidatus Omnitrophota bacterium]
MNYESEKDVLKKTYIALKKTQKRLHDLESSLREPIAVVGMSCRFPGGGNDPEKFWEFLENGGDASSPVPPERWNAQQYYDPAPGAPGMTHAAQANFLTVPVDGFDAHFFNISGKESLSLDPQQRLLLEITWEALEDAALDAAKLSGSRTGVFVGISSDDYTQSHRHSGHNGIIDGYALTGTCFAPAAGRISYTFGFEGPCMAVDTACSSSLAALHLACHSLRNQESDMALAAGVNLILSPIFHICSTKLGTISPDGRCKTFDASADGYGRGEGCGALLLKRLSDAIKDNNRILAVLRGTAVNQDGKSNGLTAPNGLAQEKVIRRALENAGLQPADIGYMEAHGTGTPLGDPIEVESIARVMKNGHTKENPILLGSVKANIGHLEAAAGISGVIKVIQSLRHEKIPPHPHLKNPSPYIPWDQLPVFVPTALTPWPRSETPRRAGVSSFGFSGTNAHAIVEEAPIVKRTMVPSGIAGEVGEDTGEKPTPAAAAISAERPVHILPLSAKNEVALKQLAARYADYFEQNPNTPIADACYTAGAGRSHFENRLAAAGAASEDFKDALRKFSQGEKTKSLTSARGGRPRLAFLFTGQGSQYVGMGRGLWDAQPVFRQAMEECDAILREYLNASLIDSIYGEKADDAVLTQTQYAQPAIFAIEYALYRLWTSWGATADIAAGHSIGEYAAACAAGIVSLPDALKLVAARGQLMQSLPAGGSMAAVFANEDEVQPLVDARKTDASLAAINSPGSVVISGRREAVAEILAKLKSKGISSQELNVSHAFHSPLMDPILNKFEHIAASVNYEAPRLLIVSTVTGKKAASGDLASASYWANQIRRPVRFLAAMETMAAENADIFLEMGAAPTLTGLARRSISQENKAFLASLKKGEDDWNFLLASLAEIYVRGAEIDWEGFDASYSRTKIALPAYPFQRKSYYMSPVQNGQSGGEISLGRNAHPYLGQKIASPCLDGGIILFQNLFTETRPAFLKEHKIYGKIISPAAAHVSMALSACRRVFGDGMGVIEEVEFTAPLVVNEGESRWVQTIIENSKSAKPSFRIVSRSAEDDAASWITHCSGNIARKSDQQSDMTTSGSSWRELEEKFSSGAMESEEFYSYIESVGYSTGPNFQCIHAIRQGTDEAFCRLQPAKAIDDAAVHPGLIDSMLQTVLPACKASATAMLEGDNILIPLHMSQVQVHRSLAGELYCYTRVKLQESIIKCEIAVFNSQGEQALEIKDFLLKLTDRQTLYRELREDDKNSIYEIEWREMKAEEFSAAQEKLRYILFADSQGVCDALEKEIEKKGEAYIKVVAGKQFEKTGDNISTIDPANAEDFMRLFEHWAKDSSPAMTKILFLWGVDAMPSQDTQALEEEEKRLCGGVLHIVHALEKLNKTDKAQLWLVTNRCQAVAPEDRLTPPASAALWGLGRALALEHPEMWGGLLDIDNDASAASALALLELMNKSNGEDQTALRRGGRRFAARLARRKAKTSRQEYDKTLAYPAVSETQAYYLDVGARKTLDELSFKIRERRVPDADEVEVRIHAAGLNFRDVLNALGQYPGDAGLMGYESAGTVAAIGENVGDLKVGDPVIAMAAPGCIGSYITLNRAFVFKKPDGMTLEEAVTIPATFLTAYYALHELGALKRGERILIHAGAGGVGMAAVQLALDAGAEIFATAGSPEKREYLRSLGVHHVLNSRTLDFADEIKRITGGRGVDAVLNSLSGEFIAKSFSVLANLGRFLEMGKIGIWDASQVRELNPTFAYYPFDLAAVSRQNPALIGRMFHELMAKFAKGDLKPLPITVFPLANAIDAYRYMAQAKHIGKIVLSRQDEIRRENIQRRGLIQSEGTYLITGGLGALGLLMVRWLAEQGAHHLALTGRSAPKPAAEAVMRELREGGAEIAVLQGDMACGADVERILNHIRSAMPPLKGIIHAAGLLDDGMMAEQTWERFQKVMAPKVRGAWNLHQATKNDDLDFFALFSSVAAIIGNLGQSNYAAANAFMDGLAHYRRQLGLAAVSVNWGPWADAGMAADMAVDRFFAQGIRYIQPETGMRLMKTILQENMIQACAFDVDWNAYGASHGLDASAGLFANLIGETAKSAADEAPSDRRDIANELREVLPAQRRGLLAARLQRIAQSVLGYNESERIAPDQPLVNQGFDSLTTVDMRNRLSKEIGASLPASLLYDYPTLDKISRYLLDEVVILEESEPAPDESKTETQSVLKEIDELLV